MLKAEIEESKALQKKLNEKETLIEQLEYYDNVILSSFSDLIEGEG